ncbi:electron transfer flavoprotein subunit beta/FixA family protein [Desulforamulus ruminis]|uniref:electron transfer flavoprotein subunit beta/FixA family protein n=1 Tax=Desulforamulus ruminis TaxID=1564 RepID=UPI002FD93BB3
MKIFVLLKQVFDTEAVIKMVDGQISGEEVPRIMNPYDEYAIEEALKIAEVVGGEVTVFSVGSGVEPTVRQALAMGAHRGYIIEDTALREADEYGIAVALAEAIKKMEYNLILAGWRASDGGSAQVAARVAQALDLPLVNLAVQLDLKGEKVTATTEIDGGTAVVEVPLPAVVTCQKGLNEPRYPSLKGIMQAKKKEVAKAGLADLGLKPAEVAAKVKTLGLYLSEDRSTGKVLEEGPAAAAQLAKLLREEAKVI